jgi:hypothetical protein
MTARDTILATYGFGDRIVNAYLADLTDADLLVRPVPGQNHIAWQLGHLISTEHNILNALKPGLAPALPEGFEAAHGRDEGSVASDDPARFFTKDVYLSTWKSQREATLSLLNELSDAGLDGEGPERTRRIAPTMGATFLLLGNHPLMHVGQFVSVRRALGKPIAI